MRAKALAATAAALLGIWGCGENARPRGGPLSEATLVGAWETRLSHAGQTADFGVEFEVDSTGSLAASIAIPPLDVWAIPIGTAEILGDTVRTGLLDLLYHADGPRLVGTLPPLLVPVHSIPVDLRPVDRLERPPTAEADLPLVEPEWTYGTGGPIWAGTTVRAGTVYAGSDDGRVHALDLRTGERVWTFPTGGAIRATPAFHRGSVLVHSDDGSLYRLSAADGTLLWRAVLADSATLRVEYGAQGFRYDSYASAPRVHQGTVYVGHWNRLHALDADDGAERWVFEAGDLVATRPAVVGDAVFFGSFDGRVYAVSTESGAALWTRDTGEPVTSSPAPFQDRIVVGSRSYDLLALRVDDGSPVWSYYYWFSWVESSPVIRDGVVYIGSSDAQRLNAIDATDGGLLWAFDTGGSTWARPAVGPDAVFVGSVGVAGYFVEHRGGFHAVDRATGRGLWRFGGAPPEDAPLWGFASSPAVAEGRVVVGGLDGVIYCFPSDGASRP